MRILSGTGHFLWRHKTIILVVFMGVYLVALDENCLLVQRMKNQRIAELEQELNSLKDQFQSDSHELEQMETQPELTERIAREVYFMKRPNEDVFVFSNPNQAQ